MVCPACKSTANRVIDTREQREGRAIRRKRKCEACERTFTTLERYERALVEKRNGDIQPFERDKVVKAIKRAASGRDAVDPEKIADRITADVLTRHEPTPTRKIGASISDELAEIDPIAFIRWALVFVDIGDLEGVKALVSSLQTGTRVKKRNSGQVERFNRAKLVESIQRAVTKRHSQEARRIADTVADEVEHQYLVGGVVSSDQIAALLLPKLKDLDETAWVRYRSVHDDPADTADFLQRLEDEL